MKMGYLRIVYGNRGMNWIKNGTITGSGLNTKVRIKLQKQIYEENDKE